MRTEQANPGKSFKAALKITAADATKALLVSGNINHIVLNIIRRLLLLPRYHSPEHIMCSVCEYAPARALPR